jgi:hypothetical protein
MVLADPLPTSPHDHSLRLHERAGHTSAGPGQTMARSIRNTVCELRGQGKTVDLVWVKGHQGTPGNERGDVLAGKAAEKAGYSRHMSIAHLKLRIQKSHRHMAPATDSPRNGGNPSPPTKEVLPRQHAHLTRPHGGSDPHRALEIRGIS